MIWWSHWISHMTSSSRLNRRTTRVDNETGENIGKAIAFCLLSCPYSTEWMYVWQRSVRSAQKGHKRTVFPQLPRLMSANKAGQSDGLYLYLLFYMDHMGLPKLIKKRSFFLSRRARNVGKNMFVFHPEMRLNFGNSITSIHTGWRRKLH